MLTGHSAEPPVAAILPLFTSMFLHASFLHIAGNMLFLWIFGDNVEDYLGHFRYLLFYLASGLAADFTYILLDANSRVPSIGASGAIAGVMGAYFILYPRARVLVWFPPIFFFHVPAWLMLGYWFLINFVSGTASSIAESTQASGGIAFWAHVGGFVAGMVMVKAFSGTAAPISVWDLVSKPSALSSQPSGNFFLADLRPLCRKVKGPMPDR